MSWYIIIYLFIVLSCIVYHILKCHSIIRKIIDTRIEITYLELKERTDKWMGEKTLDISLDVMLELKHIRFNYDSKEGCYKYSIHPRIVENRMRRTLNDKDKN